MAYSPVSIQYERTMVPSKIIDDPKSILTNWSPSLYVRRKPGPVVHHNDPAPWVSKHTPWWKKIFGVSE